MELHGLVKEGGVAGQVHLGKWEMERGETTNSLNRKDTERIFEHAE